MKVLSFDTSKKAGWARYETGKHPSSIKCGVLEFPDKASIEYCADQMGLKVTALIKEERPDLVIMETALKMSPGGTMATVVSCMLHGAVLATIANYGIPWVTISSGTWRSMFYGKGYKPPQKITKLAKPDSKGRWEKVENLWKEAIVIQCELEGIVLPTKKTIAHNAGEAAAIAICWRGGTLHAKRYEPAFKSFLQQRNDRSAAPDLFGSAA
jgi:Holliday junction resolvasome RuvABC endonuclease subunit